MGGSFGKSLVRTYLAVQTGGFSELFRDKPFQPGGGERDTVKNAATSFATGGYVTTGAGAVEKGKEALAPDIPVPAAEPAPDLTTKAVQDAVSQASRRRSKSRGFASTVLNKEFMQGSGSGLKSTYGS